MQFSTLTGAYMKIAKFNSTLYTVEFSSAQVEFNLSYHKWYAHVGSLTAVEGELA